MPQWLIAVLILSFLSLGCTDRSADTRFDTIVVRETYREPWESEGPAPETTIVTEIADDTGREPEPTQYRTEAAPDAPRVLRERVRVLRVPASGPLDFEVVESRASISVAFLPGGPEGRFDENDHWVCGYVSKNPGSPPPFNPGNIDFSDIHLSGIPNDCVDLGYCPSFTSCDDGGGPGAGPGGGSGGSGGGSGGGGAHPPPAPDPCPPTDFESCLFCCADKAKDKYPDNASARCRRWYTENVFNTCWDRCKKDSKTEPTWIGGKWTFCPDTARMN